MKLDNSAAAVDMFRCESLILRSHWVLVVMDQFTRRIVGFAVHSGALDGPDICRLFGRIVAGTGSPQYLSSDNDPLFRYRQWKANLRILDIAEIKTVPLVPMSHPFIERLIGTVRRESTDQTPFWSTSDLEKKLNGFTVYYNSARVHHPLGGATPQSQSGKSSRKPVRLDDYR